MSVRISELLDIENIVRDEVEDSVDNDGYALVSYATVDCAAERCGIELTWDGLVNVTKVVAKALADLGWQFACECESGIWVNNWMYNEDVAF